MNDPKFVLFQMIDKSSLLKIQNSLYLEFIPKDGLFHKMLLMSLTGFLTG